MNIPVNNEGQNRRNEFQILLLCCLIAVGLRLYTLDHKSLWIDEIHTFNDSRDDLAEQIQYYKENPAYLHPPLFFVLTHLFYPFEQPEKDLRILPMIFGVLSIPMLYLLARSFSPTIAIPSALCLAVMAYHIDLSQNGRPYSLIMFLGMVGLYFFMRYLKTLKRFHLLLAALVFALMLHLSYSSILFLLFSQLFWFYPDREKRERTHLSSAFLLNGTVGLLCFPWFLFLALNYRGQPIMDPLQPKALVSFTSTLYGILHDWLPYAPLIIVSSILLAGFPFLSRSRKSALILLCVFILPIGTLSVVCRVFDLNHFVTSRYFISFLPTFLITLYLSIEAFALRFERVNKLVRFRLFFLILFVTSNLVILPLYYRSERQDFRGLANYLKGQLQDNDTIIVGNLMRIPGLMHYFGIRPQGRHHLVQWRRVSDNELEYRVSLAIQDKNFVISCSKTFWTQYALQGKRLWAVTNGATAKTSLEGSPFIFKGFFDASFLNFAKFPTDDSMYLFLWDPAVTNGKGIDLPVDLFR